MNTRHYYLRLLRTLALAALTAAATAACSDDNGDPDGREPINPDDANPGIAVNFTANINPGSDADPDGAPGTRTVLKPDGRNGFTVEWKGKDNNPTSGYDWIYIWAAQGTNMIGPKSYAPSISAASSPLEPKWEDSKLTLTETGDWTFTAIYGYYEDQNGTIYSVIQNQVQSAPGNTEHIADRDFSVAIATKTVEAGDMPNIINFKFEHKLSALQLRITNQTGEELTVKEIRLSADGGQIAYQRDYDVATGKWKTTGERKSDFLQFDALNFPALPSGGTESQDFHMLLFPEPEHSRTNMTVTVITSRGEYSRTRPAPEGGFLAGKNYLTDIVIKTDGLDPATEKWVETISSKAELIAFRDKVNNGNTYDGKTVRLTKDIALTGEWTPIGKNSLQAFQGTFDGGGYHISGLSITNTTSSVGLFGYVSGGTVRNLRVSGTVTTTGQNAGGIAGYLNGSTVENCIFDGEVSGDDYVGGIAGVSFENSRIAGCHTKGKVTATATNSQNAGGIAGWNYDSTIDGCYSEAEVTTGYERAGGIAGSNENGGTITHCYATGKVSGMSSVGGIVGYQYDGTLTGCIALNPGLTRTEEYITLFGRIVGFNQGTSTATSCGAYDGMTFTDASGSFDGTGEAGDALPAADCLTPAAYTSRDFPEATATTPGWAFSAAAPWTYLPWNKAFEDFPGITDPAQYRIAVPAYLSGGTN